jgi:hypothetical protein
VTAKKRKKPASRRGNVGILIDSGKPNATTQRLTMLLHQALMAAIAGGREDTAKVIAQEMSKFGSVNNAVISGCHIQMGES